MDRTRTAGEAVMTPADPRWDEFLVRLRQAKHCIRTTQYARAALEAMPGVDVAASLLALRELGGLCDCAILYGIGFDSVRRPDRESGLAYFA